VARLDQGLFTGATQDAVQGGRINSRKHPWLARINLISRRVSVARECYSTHVSVTIVRYHNTTRYTLSYYLRHYN
jgi:hypothetical protein